MIFCDGDRAMFCLAIVFHHKKGGIPMRRISLCLALSMSLMFGCAGPMAITSAPKGAIQGTGEAPSKFLRSLPADDQEEFELAQRGLIASEPAVDIRTREGKPVWDMKRYGFLALEKPAPDTVNPALSRYAQGNTFRALSQAPTRRYQVRGYD